MISYLSGIYKNDSIITNSGVGYKVILLHSYEENTELDLYISTIYRENSITLYGFDDRYVRDLFENLIKINGIGPEILSKVKGLGSKGANRIISDFIIPKNIKIEENSNYKNLEIIELLENLGFEKNIILKVLPTIDENDESKIVSAALSKLRSL
jgi:Holliday junction DNA helicase RuvA